MKITRSISEPIKSFSNWDETWKGEDMGLIACWQSGVQKGRTDYDLAARARSGELVALVWKGGSEKFIKKHKFGSLNYLAMWQGLRGENLDIDPNNELTLKCTKTGTTVTYTNDLQKLNNL